MLQEREQHVQRPRGRKELSVSEKEMAQAKKVVTEKDK